MSLLDLIAMYALAGVVCALAVWRRHRQRPRWWLSSLLALFLWPLWGPFALMDAQASPQEQPQPAAQPPQTALSRRLEKQLDEAVSAAEGTAFAAMLGPAAATRMAREIRQACARLKELDKLLCEPGFDRAAALAQVDTLLQRASREPAVAGQLRSARLHLDNVERLARLQLAQQRAIGELEQAIGALHSQLVVARYAGSGEEGVSTIVSDLWSRVEGLGEVLEPPTAAEAASNVVPLVPPGDAMAVPGDTCQGEHTQRVVSASAQKAAAAGAQTAAAVREQKAVAVSEQTALSRGA